MVELWCKSAPKQAQIVQAGVVRDWEKEGQCFICSTAKISFMF